MCWGLVCRSVGSSCAGLHAAVVNFDRQSLAAGWGDVVHAQVERVVVRLLDDRAPAPARTALSIGVAAQHRQARIATVTRAEHDGSASAETLGPGRFVPALVQVVSDQCDTFHRLASTATGVFVQQHPATQQHADAAPLHRFFGQRAGLEPEAEAALPLPRHARQLRVHAVGQRCFEFLATHAFSFRAVAFAKG
ncbi:hypothetical protein QFZ83_001554 [Variovorax sp. W1I1]|nr:hypothetical protein [Variovorax sp. W1I1]